MSNDKKFDLVVIGSGPGGYVAAIRAAREGLRTAVVESAGRLGGVCLNWGCIPSKALLKSALLYEQIGEAEKHGIQVGEISFDWPAVVKRSRRVTDRLTRGVDYLMKKNNIAVFRGRGVLEGGDTAVRVEGEEEALLTAKHIILATGGHSRALPGLEPDGRRIITSREALALEKKPESIVIVGAGAIGMEFAYLLNAFQTRVTVVEILPRILPLEDEELTAELEKIFKRKGMRLLTGSRVEQVTSSEDRGGCIVKISTGGETEQIDCETVLLAVGVSGNTEGLGLEQAGVEVEKGFIKVDDGYATTGDNIRAIGDCIGAPLLAHAASREGILAVESILGRECAPLDPLLVPSCTYCQPQLARVGLTETEAHQAGLEVTVGRYPFRSLGKAVAAGETEGLVKVVAGRDDGKILGVHILGAEAVELITEPALAATHGIGTGGLEQVIHPHPSLAEAVLEAASGALGRAIHL
ncbi:MAG: dihydrolipoyl dehydrogenase [Gemmatimonadota bacterium]|nr:dihydrolipoyl dehydrogenase [Gemmatimonadota bacterium]